MRTFAHLTSGALLLAVAFWAQPVDAHENTPSETMSVVSATDRGLETAEDVATQGTITGRVIEEGTGRALAGAQVQIVGTGQGTLAGSDGRYEITGVAAGEVQVRVQILGFATRTRSATVASGETVELDFQMAQQALALDELVVTGTAGGTQRRALGNVVDRLDTEQLRRVSPGSDPQNLLAGRTPGVQVTPGAGQVGGGGAPIRIRGSSSAALGNDPIVYIDGVRMNADPNSGPTDRHGTSNRLNDINPEDIASIEVIKGPAAATLYGTEASNGVIQIITKRGAEGATTFDVSTSVGTTWMHDPAGTIGETFWRNPQGELISHNLYEAEQQFGAGELFDYGLLQDYNISARGGTEALRYFASIRRQDDQGIVDWNTSDRLNVRAGINVLATDNLDIAINAAYSTGETVRTGPYWQAIYWNSPANSPAAGSDNPIRGWYQRPHEAFVEDYRVGEEVDRSTWSGTLSYDPVDWLSNRLTFGTDVTEQFSTQLWLQDPAGAAGWWGADSRGRRDVTRLRSTFNTFDYAVTARWRLGESIGMATSGGFQYLGKEEWQTYSRGDQLPARTVTTVGGAAESNASESIIENVTVGGYLQQQFDWEQRIFVTAAVRMDDNSAFGAEFDAAVYPKISATWVMHEEDFWNFDRISQFRLRGAFGAAGQQPDVFDAARLYRAETGPGDVPVLTPQAFGNPDLAPERGEELELGFDAGFFEDRLSVEFTQYFRNTRDAIVARPLAPSDGFPGSQLVNVGLVKNWGTELQTDFVAVDGANLRWDIGVGLGLMRNEIDGLGDEVEFIGAGFDRQHRAGFPLASWFHRRIVSADFVEGNSGAVTNLMCDGGAGQDGREFGGSAVPCDEAPDLYWGNTEPTWEASFSSNLEYGNWGLFTSIDGRGGHIVMDNGINASHTSFQNTRMSWEQTDPIFMGYRAIGRSPIGFHDADFLKLREMSLRYSIPNEWVARWGINNASVNVAARNIATLWQSQPEHNYGGESVMDPEISRPGQAFAGEQQAVWPPLRTATVNFRFSF
jgi:TonB-dependent starch-binding outer membrane protein SusC